MSYMFGADIEKVRPERTDVIEVEAPDREALLVDRLSELLYRATSEYQAYVDFRIDEFSDRRLAARAGVASAEAISIFQAAENIPTSCGRKRYNTGFNGRLPGWFRDGEGADDVLLAASVR
jgi:hypothetical protein